MSSDKNRIGTIANLYFFVCCIVFVTTLFGFKPPEYAYTVFSPAQLGTWANQKLKLNAQ